ncbi:probable LRR receptor-like serine/threonine-protein kinase At4g36180 [Phalaenopsis equestris]|uniref:probable LRR receptor-like serine/threonine-protein kinase At4g36180 n=1 Tax=Phalaenopsis equestris TaxID=78828 RepID=UPI0009E5B43F|nr:probable LRR receptor-like serine/threonine-protein kinase At4g36180 [Phalaenopsis equestris]
MGRVEVLLLLIVTLLPFTSFILRSKGSVAISKVHQRCNFEERNALLSFKQSLFDPLLALSTWKIGEDCCTWEGVSCSNTTNHVIKLDLSEEGSLNATSVVPSLFLLKHLQYLCLSAISFNQASIPHSIGSLTKLRYLDVSYSGFVGVIPPHLGNLTDLHYLDLSGNYLVALNLTWMSHPSSLNIIDMSDVNLTSAMNWLHEIKVLPSLSILYLSFCNLQTLPTSLPYSNFSSTLNTFDLSYNNLSGRLPNWLGQFKCLKIIHLQSNNFNGPISFSSLNSLCVLNDLNLAINNFIELLEDGSVLKCKEYNMMYMDISYNQLRGSIPEWIGKMRNLRKLDFGNNQLNGSIPQSLGQLINLVYLDLHSNHLQGSISDIIFANLSQLYHLDLSDNDLDFNLISFNWIPPFQTSFLSISSCLIGPQFPIWLRNQNSLSHLEISNCGIFDIIPSWFWNITSQITYLNISQNEIRGELPMSLNNTLAVTIDLKSNQLEGRLPQLLNNVAFVFFSNNKFSSGIELYLNANMSFLKVLDLSQNHLSDEIPYSICQLPPIILLDLSHNNLLGEVPKCHGSTSSHTKLQFISLAYNNLWGSIPQWIGNQSILSSLHLNNNEFQGEIPSLQNCSKLITIDLGH